jgi:hypothetical protein
MASYPVENNGKSSVGDEAGNVFEVAAVAGDVALPFP